MREPTEDHIAADFARDRYTHKIKPQPSDYNQVAQCCIGLFLIVLGCMAALALALQLEWQP